MEGLIAEFFQSFSAIAEFLILTEGLGTRLHSIFPKVLSRSVTPEAALTFTYYPANIYSRHSGIFIVNFEHISHLFLVFLLLTLNK